MSGRSWLSLLMRWAGGPAPTSNGPKGKGGGATSPGGGPEKGESATDSALLKTVLAQADLSAKVQAALDGYRSALCSLEGRGGTTYQAGVLEAAEQELEQLPLPNSLGATLVILMELFASCADMVFRGLLIGGECPAVLIFIDGLVKSERLELSVLDPLTNWGDPDQLPGTDQDLAMWLESVATGISQTSPVKTVGQAVDAVLGGETVLLVDGVAHGVKLAIPGWERRAVEEPTSEAVVRGPREGFTETLGINTALLRHRIKSPHFKIERQVVGRRTKTVTNILYLKDVASPGVVEEVRKRLQRIDIDGVLDTGMLEEFIEDQPSSLFPQVLHTERPDRVAAAILEGQVAILADGSPFALIVPVTFWSFMTAAEDYYERFWSATLILWLRVLFMVIALVAPSLYVAVITVHQEMLPTNLLLSIAASREGIPFPALVEVFLMELFFEALREAGVRLPRQIGQAVSMVGALVIGQAAVQAGLASAPVVIIAAATGIASFTTPGYNLAIAIRMLRFPLLFLAGSLGLFGIMVGLIAILVHLCALRSFGVPYMQPVAPISWGDLKDTLIRAPLWLMGKRPDSWGPINRRRQAPWLKPGPGGDGP